MGNMHEPDYIYQDLRRKINEWIILWINMKTYTSGGLELEEVCSR